MFRYLCSSNISKIWSYSHFWELNLLPETDYRFECFGREFISAYTFSIGTYPSNQGSQWVGLGRVRGSTQPDPGHFSTRPNPTQTERVGSGGWPGSDPSQTYFNMDQPDTSWTGLWFLYLDMKIKYFYRPFFRRPSPQRILGIVLIADINYTIWKRPKYTLFAHFAFYSQF